MYCEGGAVKRAAWHTLLIAARHTVHILSAMSPDVTGSAVALATFACAVVSLAATDLLTVSGSSVVTVLVVAVE